MIVKISELNNLPSRQLLVYSQHWKHQKNVLNLFKVNNKDTRTTPITSFWCLFKTININSVFSCPLTAYLAVHTRNSQKQSPRGVL